MQYKTWQDVTVKELCGKALSTSPPSTEEYKVAEPSVLRRAQQESFREECHVLSETKLVSSQSLLTLAPEMDTSVVLIRVGG